MRRILAALAVSFVLSPLAVLAQDRPMIPKGRWWRMPEVQKRLNLTQEQQERLDHAFLQRSKELIDLKASMEKSAIELRASLEKFDSDPDEVMKYATQVGEARGALFRKEIEMMIEIRKELDEEQWMNLREAIEHQGGRMRERRPPGSRPTPPPQKD